MKKKTDITEDNPRILFIFLLLGIIAIRLVFIVNEILVRNGMDITTVKDITGFGMIVFYFISLLISNKVFVNNQHNYKRGM